MALAPKNTFTDGPLGTIYFKTAFPIIFVMGVNGLLNVTDALFLGWYVGPEALAAVTLMFPAFILVVALSSLVSGGMSSLLARHLGAGEMGAAHAVFAGAHGLALMVSALFIGLFFAVGPAATLLAANGSKDLADMGLVYLQITVFFSPLLFVLSVNSDALRNEGRVGFMAAMSLLVSLANIAFNYVLIAVFEMGVAGSAYGTAAAQALALLIIAVFRSVGPTALRPSVLLRHSPFSAWRGMVILGGPQSLNFIGLALGSAAILAALQWVGAPGYGDTVSAYGIITRVITFSFLPLLGLTFAMQTITGNNFGAQRYERSNASLRISLWVSFIYCAILQVLVMAFPGRIAAAFVDDAVVIAEVVRILPIMTSAFVLAGPLIMVSSHFQAVGAAGRSALLKISKTYAFAIPLTFILAAQFGEIGIWLAGPLAEVLQLGLTALVLVQGARRYGLRFGIFDRTEVDGSELDQTGQVSS
jgi:putative MATE family efflux protein